MKHFKLHRKSVDVEPILSEIRAHPPGQNRRADKATLMSKPKQTASLCAGCAAQRSWAGVAEMFTRHAAHRWQGAFLAPWR